MTEEKFKEFVSRLKENFGERSVDVLDHEGGKSIYIHGSRLNPILVFHFTEWTENIDGQLHNISLSLPFCMTLDEFGIHLERYHLAAIL